MKRVLFAVDHNRMACVTASLGPDNVFRLCREEVNGFSFSFVSPLRADYCYC